MTKFEKIEIENQKIVNLEKIENLEKEVNFTKKPVKITRIDSIFCQRMRFY